MYSGLGIDKLGADVFSCLIGNYKRPQFDKQP